MKRIIIPPFLLLLLVGCSPHHKEIISLKGEHEEIVETTVAELRQLAERHGNTSPEFLSDFQFSSLQLLQLYKAEALDDGEFLESPESQDIEHLYIPVDSTFGRLINEFLPEDERRDCIHGELIKLDQLDSILFKYFHAMPQN